jgi:hypothetical protein
LQVREYLHLAAAATGEPLLASQPGESWKDALSMTVERWPGPGKLVLALDEFQWTVEASPELPSVLQELWDRTWRANGRVLLILCGSYVGFMEREVLGKRSPLFGRRTAQILLRPFDHREAAEFHPGYSLTDRARAYMICGGVPLYHEKFRSDRSIEDNIAANLLAEHAPLFQEPHFLLREELRDTESYYGVLLAVAAGHGGSLRAIAEASGIAPRSLPYYLQQLQALGYVGRRWPVRPGRRRRIDVRYVIEDPLLRFWFRFVYPDMSAIIRRGPSAALVERVGPGLDAWFGGCFERLCREALPILYADEGVTAAFEVGEYWDRTVQIDLVGMRGDGWIDLGECKWGEVRSPARLEAELEGKVRRYPNPDNATIGRRIFTRRLPGGAGRRDGRVRWHDLASLYDGEGSPAPSGRTASR